MKLLVSVLAIFVAHYILGLASLEELDWETWWAGAPWVAFIFTIAILKLRLYED